MSLSSTSLMLLLSLPIMLDFPANCASLDKRPYIPVLGHSSIVSTEGMTPDGASSSFLVTEEPPSASSEDPSDIQTLQPLSPTGASMPLVDPVPLTTILSEPFETSGSVSPSAIEVPISTITPAPASPETPSTPQSGSAPGCTPYPCNIFFQYVGVYYTLEEGANTACQTDAGLSAPTLPSGIAMPPSPSGLMIFTSILASDGCQKIGTTFDNYVRTFGPGELSSWRDNAAYSFNFQDLPCPPESVHWTQTGSYAPMIALPPWMTTLDPAWENCVAGHGQGIDPFRAMARATRGSDAKEGSPIRRLGRAVHGHEHQHGRSRAAPRATAATTTAAVT